MIKYLFCWCDRCQMYHGFRPLKWLIEKIYPDRFYKKAVKDAAKMLSDHIDADIMKRLKRELERSKS